MDSDTELLVFNHFIEPFCKDYITYIISLTS